MDIIQNKSLLFAEIKREWYDVSESISQRNHRAMPEENGKLAEVTLELRNRVEAATRNAQEAERTLSQQKQQEIEQRIAEVYAKENGLWLPMHTIFLWLPMPSGNENDVYLNTDNGFLYKVNNLMYVTSWYNGIS